MAGNDGVIELTVAETNQLRKKLGLSLLKEEAPIKSSEDAADVQQPLLRKAKNSGDNETKELRKAASERCVPESVYRASFPMLQDSGKEKESH